MRRNRYLSHMNGIRAFEAASRHLSFTQAAAELNVTQAAISQQIKRFEDRLGLALFRRANNHLFLTGAGQALMPKVSRAFDLLESGLENLLTCEAGATLTCRVPSSFSIQWLAPRLERFHVRHPGVDIRLVAMRKSDHSDEDAADIVIRNGTGDQRDNGYGLLMREHVFPVCSPSLLRGPHRISTVDSLGQQSLLHVSGYIETWDKWLFEAGQPDLPIKPGLHFDQSVTAIQAAVNGLGVVLGRSSLIETELASGRLVAPFDIWLLAEDAYWIACRDERAKRSHVIAFHDWLLAEAKAAQPVYD